MVYMMIANIILVIAGVFFFVWAYRLLKAVYRHNAGQDAETATDNGGKQTEKHSSAPEKGGGQPSEEWWKGMKPKALFVKSMEELGCKCEKSEEKDYEYYVKYQGETYTVHIEDDATTIYIYDTFWYEVSLDDLDMFSEARRLVNEINFNNLATLIYAIDKENNKMYLHTCTRGLFTDFIPFPDKYLASLFYDMQRMQRMFMVKIAQFKGDEA